MERHRFCCSRGCGDVFLLLSIRDFDPLHEFLLMTSADQTSKICSRKVLSSNKMADYDSDSSNDDLDGNDVVTDVLLGYVSKDDENTSGHLGGHPVCELHNSTSWNVAHCRTENSD